MDTSRNLGLLREYMTYLRVEKGLRPLTCEAYDSALKTFAEFLESRHGVLLTATQQDVAAFLEHLRTHGIDSRSAARKLSCIRGFYKWLLLDRRIHHDPTVNIESPKAWRVLPKSLAEPEVRPTPKTPPVEATPAPAPATHLAEEIPKASTATPAAASETTIRLNVTLLDSLMTLAGELVLNDSIRIPRPDVISAVGEQMGFSDARCGFIAYVPIGSVA